MTEPDDVDRFRDEGPERWGVRLETGPDGQPRTLLLNGEAAADLTPREDGTLLITTAYGEQRVCADLREARDFLVAVETWRRGDGTDPYDLDRAPDGVRDRAPDDRADTGAADRAREGFVPRLGADPAVAPYETVAPQVAVGRVAAVGFDRVDAEHMVGEYLSEQTARHGEPTGGWQLDPYDLAEIARRYDWVDHYRGETIADARNRAAEYVTGATTRAAGIDRDRHPGLAGYLDREVELWTARADPDPAREHGDGDEDGDGDQDGGSGLAGPVDDGPQDPRGGAPEAAADDADRDDGRASEETGRDDPDVAWWAPVVPGDETLTRGEAAQRLTEYEIEHVGGDADGAGADARSGASEAGSRVAEGDGPSGLVSRVDARFLMEGDRFGRGGVVHVVDDVPVGFDDILTVPTTNDHGDALWVEVPSGEWVTLHDPTGTDRLGADRVDGDLVRGGVPVSDGVELGGLEDDGPRRMAAMGYEPWSPDDEVTVSRGEAVARLAALGFGRGDAETMVGEYLDESSRAVGIPVHQWGLDRHDVDAITDTYRWVSRSSGESLAAARERAGRETGRWSERAALAEHDDPAQAQKARRAAELWAGLARVPEPFTHTPDDDTSDDHASDDHSLGVYDPGEVELARGWSAVAHSGDGAEPPVVFDGGGYYSNERIAQIADAVDRGDVDEAGRLRAWPGDDQRGGDRLDDDQRDGEACAPSAAAEGVEHEAPEPVQLPQQRSSDPDEEVRRGQLITWHSDERAADTSGIDDAVDRGGDSTVREW